MRQSLTLRYSSKEESKARTVRRFFGKALVHTKGKWAGKPFELHDWQWEGIVKPVLCKLREDGTRQHRTAYVSIPRKNGKSELGAALALWLLVADGEAGAEIYSAAADRDQASLVFAVAAQMARMSPYLSRELKVIDSQKRIVHPKSGSVYRAIAADAAGSHGFNSHGIIFDEIHAQPNRELWDVLTTSTGAREQPLVFGITTAGYDRQSICYELDEYATKLITGVVEDPTFWAYIQRAGTGDDWRSERTWHACNPALGVFRSLDEMRDMARRAEQVPALQNTFRRLYLNQWTQSETRYIDLAAWDESAGDCDAEALEGLPCFGGLDLASTTDIAAFVLVFPPEYEGGPFKSLCRFWVPAEAIRQRSQRDRAPYEQWARDGEIIATEGNVTDYRAIRDEIIALGERYDVRQIAFDRWGATQLSQDLQDAGFTMVPYGQGFASMAAPTKELLTLILAKRMHHGGNPVLRWMADNLMVRQDPAGNVKPDKAKSSEKIDGMVALIMGLGRAILGDGGPSAYEDAGVAM